jgi:hypothetical protein
MEMLREDKHGEHGYVSAPDIRVIKIGVNYVHTTQEDFARDGANENALRKTENQRKTSSKVHTNKK